MRHLAPALWGQGGDDLLARRKTCRLYLLPARNLLLLGSDFHEQRRAALLYPDENQPRASGMGEDLPPGSVAPQKPSHRTGGCIPSDRQGTVRASTISLSHAACVCTGISARLAILPSHVSLGEGAKSRLVIGNNFSKIPRFRNPCTWIFPVHRANVGFRMPVLVLTNVSGL